MTLSSPFIALFRKVRFIFPAAALLCAFSLSSFAASVRGYVTDTTGARVTGATVSLLSSGGTVGSAVSAADGSFQILSTASGRFFLVVSAKSFRQLQTPDFYAGQFDSLERSVVLEPEWVRESIVVTPTGTPTPQGETSSATTVLGPQELALSADLTEPLRMMPGTVVVQQGQRGAQSSLFIRGGNSNNNKVLLDGVDAGALGGQFDFGSLSTTAVESVEIYRGPGSSLYGADAESGVVSLTTPHGTTSFPSVLMEAEAGNFNTSRGELQVAGARGKLDYLGAYSWLQTSNALPHDQYHLATGAANLGLQLSASTLLRGTLHYGVDATGVPNAWDFYHVADDATEKDQNLYVSAAIENQTTASFHQSAHYGLTRKREQVSLWSLSGEQQDFTPFCYGPGTLGETVTITGANGYSATGRAVLDCSTFNSQYVSNRDELIYRGDLTITPHLTALIGFQYEEERGSAPGSTFYEPVLRSNYDYQAAVHGDFKNRFFYTLAGGLEHYSLFGVQTTPRAGVSYYVLRSRSGIFSGTRLLFNYGDSVREPTMPEQQGSLYAFLQKYSPETLGQLPVGQISAPQARTYEGGIEQSFLSRHIVLRATYFHNQFGKQIEYVGLNLIPALTPNLSAAQQATLQATLQANYAFELTVNSQAFRAQGAEASIESGIGRDLFLRGGYTYLDAVVERSFTNSDQELLGPIPTFDGIPVGPYAPLVGARPFRRPPHTGYFTATYAPKRFTLLFKSYFSSRSDDSTYLQGADSTGGNSLLLPNRNLDFGYTRLDLGASYHLLSWMDIYGQAENLLSDRHIAPIGYQSLPFNFRAGMRINFGLHKGR
jgi:vitamin B12 transporter